MPDPRRRRLHDLEQTVFRSLAGELRAGARDAPPVIRGLAAPYETRQVIHEGSDWIESETYVRGCFGESVAGAADILSCFNHDPNFPLGRRSSDTLTVSETDAGLSYSVTLDPDDAEAMRILGLVRRGTVYGSSVWFRVQDFEERKHESEGEKTDYEFRILRAEVRELGPVTEPVYTASTAAVRRRARHAHDAAEEQRKRTIRTANAEFLAGLAIPRG